MTEIKRSSPFRSLLLAIAGGDSSGACRIVVRHPEVARQAVEEGATRQNPGAPFIPRLGHYVYRGDTALHVAAAAYDQRTARVLLENGAAVRARNRRGAEPLHYAADGNPSAPGWDRVAQAAVIEQLVRAGADPDALDGSGVAPLHRAVRTRCAGAVRALLLNGADPTLPNRRGSTPHDLATRTTGRGGSGSTLARMQQAEILRLLEGAVPAVTT